MHSSLGSISLDVASRILSILADSKCSKTRLALKAGLNYSACVRYLTILMTLNCVQFVQEGDGWEFVYITELGRDMLKDLSKPVSTHRLKSILHDSKSAKDSDDPSTEKKTTTVNQRERVGIRRRAQLIHNTEDKNCSLGKKNPIKAEFCNHERHSIMIVDDEPDVLYTYISFLKGTHYNVRAFLKPDEALAHFAAAKQPSYDFVILDIRMPEINGLQLYQRLKAISPETRIIFITSLDAAAELTSVLKDVKPFEVIRKPLSRDKFLRVIEAQLLRHKASKNRH